LILKVFYQTGIRVGELCDMKHKDINFDNHQALIKGKGSKVRKIILGKNLSEGL